MCISVHAVAQSDVICVARCQEWKLSHPLNIVISAIKKWCHVLNCDGNAKCCGLYNVANFYFFISRALWS